MSLRSKIGSLYGYLESLLHTKETVNLEVTDGDEKYVIEVDEIWMDDPHRGTNATLEIEANDVIHWDTMEDADDR